MAAKPQYNGPGPILGKPHTYTEETLAKCSKLDLALIYIRSGGDVSKVSGSWLVSDEILQAAASGDIEALQRMLKWKSGDLLGGMTKPKLIKEILEMKEQNVTS